MAKTNVTVEAAQVTDPTAGKPMAELLAQLDHPDEKLDALAAKAAYDEALTTREELQTELAQAKLLADELERSNHELFAENEKLQTELRSANEANETLREQLGATTLAPDLVPGEPAPALGTLIDWLADNHLIDHTARLRATELAEQQGFGRTAATE
jgi:paraquat-inducible protein B